MIRPRCAKFLPYMYAWRESSTASVDMRESESPGGPATRRLGPLGVLGVITPRITVPREESQIPDRIIPSRYLFRRYHSTDLSPKACPPLHAGVANVSPPYITQEPVLLLVAADGALVIWLNPRSPLIFQESYFEEPE